MAGRELDLYDGVPDTDRVRDNEVTAPRSAAPVSETWATRLWASFPREVRDRYVPVSVLGEGGMGVVLEAFDKRMDRPVAVKGLKDPRGITGENRDRQSREVRIAARLTHPNILPVYDVWLDADGGPWCSMLCVGGMALAADQVLPEAGDAAAPALHQGPLRLVPTLSRRLEELASVHRLEDRPLAELLDAFLQICRAVGFAHSRGVVHRDLKPDNVLLGASGEVLVADWGVAQSDREPPSNDIVGTRGYAAPEQFGSFGVPRSDARTDVFALGCILFEMIAGRPAAAPPTEMAGMPGATAPHELSMPSRVPRELAAIVQRATQHEPARRHPDVATLQRAVESYLAGGIIEGIEYSRIERVRKWIHANRAIAAAMAVAGILVPAVAIQVLWSRARIASELAMSQAQYRRAQTSVAQAHETIAREDDKRGALDLGIRHAQLAFTAMATAEPDTEPLASAFSILARRNGPPERLLWAADLGGRGEVIDFLDDGSLRAGSRSVRLWTFPRNGGAPRHVDPIQGEVWGLALAPGAPRLATGGATGLVNVFDTLTGARVATLKGHTQQLWSLDFGPGGTLLATGSFDHTVRLWDVPRATSVATFGGHTGQVWAVAISRNGRYLASGEDVGKVHIFDIATRTERHTLTVGHPVSALAFSPDERSLAVAGSSPRITVLAVETGRPTVPIETEQVGVSSLAFSPDGRRLASGAHDGVIEVHTLDGGPKVKLIGHDQWVSALRFTGRGDRLASAAQDDTARLWDVRIHPPQFAGHSADTQRVVLSRTGDWLASTDGHTVRRFATATGAAIAAHDWPASALAVGPKGELAALVLRTNGLTVERDGQPPCSITLNSPSVGGTLSPDGRMAAVVDAAGRVTLVDTRAGSVTRSFYSGESHVQTLDFSPGGETLATGGTAKATFIHDLVGGTLRTLTGHTETIECLAFSPDGRLVASGSQDFTARVYDRLSGRLLLATPPGLNHVISVAFTQDGSSLVLGTMNSEVHVYRLPGGAHTAQVFTAATPAADVAIAGNLLATAGGRAAQLWALDVMIDPSRQIARILEKTPLRVERGLSVRPAPAEGAHPLPAER